MALSLYEGTSLLDFKTPVTVLANEHSQNQKTGDMLQTWILLRDQHPLDAVKTGNDSAICGQCVHRDAPRSCYVNLMFGVNSIWKTARTPPASLSLIGKGRMVRLGAYGDPAAVPVWFWQELLRHAEGWTGYTHQWRTCDQRLRQLCMASVETDGDRRVAKRMGWRTYRTGVPASTKLPGEALCPASNEAGNKLTCEVCKYCDGTARNLRGDVFIPIHGAKHVIRNYISKVAAPQAAAVDS